MKKSQHQGDSAPEGKKKGMLEIVKAFGKWGGKTFTTREKLTMPLCSEKRGGKR